MIMTNTLAAIPISPVSPSLSISPIDLSKCSESELGLFLSQRLSGFSEINSKLSAVAPSYRAETSQNSMASSAADNSFQLSASSSRVSFFNSSASCLNCVARVGKKCFWK
nr:receptor-transporting protein 4-like isoform X1 [Biomphalaria glabrata]